jgi:hypothetical protein
VQNPEWTYLSARRIDTWYPSWQAAKTAELEAIHAEKPAFNIQGSRGRWGSFIGSYARVDLASGGFLDLVYTGHGWSSPEAAEAEAQWRRAQDADTLRRFPALATSRERLRRRSG